MTHGGIVRTIETRHVQGGTIELCVYGSPAYLAWAMFYIRVGETEAQRVVNGKFDAVWTAYRRYE